MALGLFFKSCDKKELLGEILLSTEVKNTVPFSGNEILTYVKNTDTAALYCTRKVNELIEANPSSNTNDYYILERDYTHFSSNELNLGFSIVTEIAFDYPKLIISINDKSDEVNGHSEGWWLPASCRPIPMSRPSRSPRRSSTPWKRVSARA